MTERYGSTQIRRSFVHFLLGRALSAAAGFVAMLLVVRLLPVHDYAQYSILFGLSEVISGLVGFGIVHALQRYVPELYGAHYGRTLRRFIGAASLSWYALLIGFLSLAFVLSEHIAPLIGLADAVDALRVCWGLVLWRCSAQYLAQILEAMLHQGRAQASYAVGSATRLAGMAWLLWHGTPALIDVLHVEMFAEATCTAAMLLALARSLHEASLTPCPDPSAEARWLRERFPAIWRFALSAYVQHLVILPGSWAGHRLIGGSLLSREAMAVFGFAQSFYEYARRYLPAQLLVNLIRPVMVARYARSGDFADAASIARGVILVNSLLTAAMISVLLVGGSEIMGVLSAGKYTQAAAFVLTALLVQLQADTVHQQLEVLAQTVERYHHLILSNLMITASVLLAVALAPHLEAYAFPVATTVGIWLSNQIIRRGLASNGFRFSQDSRHVLQVLLAMLLATTAGTALRLCGAPWLLDIVVSVAAYVGLAAVATRKPVLDFLALLGQPPAKRPSLHAPHPSA